MRCKLPLLATLTVLIGFMTQSLSATTNKATVGLCAGSGTHYTTIALAIAAIPTDGTVSVCPGTYAEQVSITKSMTLIGIKGGTNDAAVIVPPPGGLIQNGLDIFGNGVAAQVFVASTSGPVTISNLTVDGTGNNIASCGPPILEGVYFQNTSGTITENAVRNQFMTNFADFGGCQNALAINVESSTNSNSVTISKNVVRAYQKNGITVTGADTGPGSLGPAVTITNNYIVGLGATSMNWPGGAAENGIQFGFGATGTISLNTVNDNIWFADTSSDSADAAAGILIYSSNGVSVLTNSVGSAQFGIVTVSDPSSGPANSTIIKSNKVVGTQLFDGIDVCSSLNTVQTNTVYGSAEAGVHLDSTCGGTGNNNSVTGNIINEACAGVLLGSGSGNTVSPNTTYNVVNTTLAGNVCPVPGPVVKGEIAKHASPRPSPYMPNRIQ